MVVTIGKDVLKNRHGNLWNIYRDENGRFKKFLFKEEIGIFKKKGRS